MSQQFTYLGDGLYCRYDGYQYYLETDRGRDSLDWVALDDHVLNSFLLFVQKTKNIKITIERLPSPEIEDIRE